MVSPRMLPSQVWTSSKLWWAAAVPGPGRVPGPGPGRAGQHRHRPRLGRPARLPAGAAAGQRVRLDLGRPGRRRHRRRPVRDALRAAGDQAGPRDRATGLLLAGWLEASAGNVDQAQDDLDAAAALAGRLGDGRLAADAQRHLAFLRIQQGRPQDVLSSAAASAAAYRRLGLPWETAASLL